MKSMIKGLIAFFILIIVGLVITMTYILLAGNDIQQKSGGFLNRFDPLLINTQTIEIEPILDINIKSYSSDIYLISSNSTEVVIKEYSASKKHQNPMVTVSQDNGTLNIKEIKRIKQSWLPFDNNHRYVEVYLPESYAGNMKVNTSSGSICAEDDLNLSHCSISSASGDLNFALLSAEDLSISTASGDIDILSIAGSAKITTSSGEIKLNEVEGKVAVSTASSDVRLDHITGAAEISTVSGEIQLSFIKLIGELKLNTTSGEVSCKLPDDTQFQFKASTVSGDIDTYFDQDLAFSRGGTTAQGVIGDKSDANIDVKTTSGDIRFTTK